MASSYQWIHEGYIPVVKLGSLVRFQQRSVVEWINKREEPQTSRG